MIKYRYALDNNQTVVEIGSEQVAKGGEFQCISCGNSLLPILGQVRQKHFRHKSQVNCSTETYLHKLAKLTFYQTYVECLANKHPFWIESLVHRNCIGCKEGCSLGSGHEPSAKQIDLTRYFKNIGIEVKDGEFTPDILLFNDNGAVLYIEMAVTHFSEPNKIMSGAKIIEIRISSENDICLFSTCALHENDCRIRFYNFRRVSVTVNYLSTCAKAVKRERWESKGQINSLTTPLVTDKPKPEPYPYRAMAIAGFSIGVKVDLKKQ